MVKLHAARSKRVSSRHRHKVERKKREHKRDLRKAAKALRKSGRAPPRSKKSRELARAALRVSNANADKEHILDRVLAAREHARVTHAVARRSRGSDADAEATHTTTKAATAKAARALLYIPVRDSNNFALQFTRALHELVFPLRGSDASATAAVAMQLPASAFVITLDARFAVQCLPLTLLDAIIEQAAQYTGAHTSLLLFVLTKCDLVSAPALVTQVSLLAHALHTRYAPHGLGSHLVAAVAAHSVHHHVTSERLCRILHQWQACSSDAARATSTAAATASTTATNMDGKVCAIVLGLPNTGRRSLCRTLASEANESRVSMVPLRAAQLQLRRTGTATATTADAADAAVAVKLAFPNAKAITLVQLPECAVLRRQLAHAQGCDVLLRSPAYVEKLIDPETPACVLYASIADKVALAQAFCQPVPAGAHHQQQQQQHSAATSAVLHAARQFLRGVGTTVRREKGLRVSPLFVSGAGTMGRVTSSSLTAHVGFTSAQQRSQATLLDATYSNATPSKLVRIAPATSAATSAQRRRQALIQKPDARNVLRLGARTFVRELCRGGNVPWAVMRAAGDVALTPDKVAAASRLFDVALCSGRRPPRDAAARTDAEEGVDDDGTAAAAHLQQLIQSLSATLKSVLPLLPNDVVAMSPDGLAFPQYSLDDEDEDEVGKQDDDGDEQHDAADDATPDKDEDDGDDDDDDEEDDDEDEDGDDDDDDDEEDDDYDVDDDDDEDDSDDDDDEDD